jgi:hypothetical protein
MVNSENFDVSRRIQQTLCDATDLSQGAQRAAANLQTEVWQNYNQLSPADYGTYLRGVASGLKSSSSFDEVAAAWTRNNTNRFDMDGDQRVDRNELNAAIQRSRDPLEKEILVSVRDQYSDIRHAGGEGFLGLRKDSLDHDDFDSFAQQNQERRDQARETRMRQGQSAYLMGPLLANPDGTRERSLFNHLDNIKGGSKDGDLSRGDFERFVQNYDRAALSGSADVNQGFYTRTNRDYAQRVADNWDSPEIERLRGKRTQQEGHYEREVTNQYITESSLRAAAGYAGNVDLYRTFKPHEAPVPKAEAPHGPTAEQLAQARAQFEEQVRQHINQEAHYTVKQGQGFDRVARDVIKHHSADETYKNEAYVEHFSNNIAKMNGRHGRLDKTPVLQPGEQLRVFDDNWVNAQIQERLKAFDVSFNQAAQARPSQQADGGSFEKR